LKEANSSELKAINNKVSTYYETLHENKEILKFTTRNYKFNKTRFDKPKPLCGYSVVVDFNDKITGFTIAEKYYYQRGFAESFKAKTEKMFSKYGKVFSTEVKYKSNTINYTASVGSFEIELKCSKGKNGICLAMYRQVGVVNDIGTKKAIMQYILKDGKTIRQDIKDKIITPWYNS